MFAFMTAVVYRCPATGLTIDHWTEPAAPGISSEVYETVTCRACNGVHLVNVATGRVLVAHREEFIPNRRWVPK
jgi:hypothetical protein